jgi:hypothetical protein
MNNGELRIENGELRIKKANLIAFIFAFLLFSCTHWIIDTETRIQMKNETGVEIYNLSLISKDGKIMVLAPDAYKAYEHELVGKFDFVVYAKGDPEPKNLGIHELKGGSVTAIITKEGDNFAMRLK